MRPNLIVIRSMMVAVLLLELAACSSRVDVVAQSLADIDAQPPIPVPPLPPYVPVQSYNYSAQQMRSPFMPPSLERDISQMGGRSIKPDPGRPKQFLEQFPLEQLIMKGTIKDQTGPAYALIEAPQGGVMRVQLGNYMGTNDGRIVSITPNEVNVVEIVPNGVDGYVERPRSLLLAGSGK